MLDGWRRKVSLLGVILIVFGVIGMAVYKFDFNSDNRIVDASQKWTFASGELIALDLGSGSNNMKVKFVKSDAASGGYVEISGKVNQDTASVIEQATIVDQALVLDLSSRQWRIFDFNFRDTLINVTVALPERMLENVKLHAKSGNLEIVDVEAQELQVQLSSGNLNFSGLAADKLAMKVTSGNIKGSGIEANVITTSTSSGNITMDGVVGTITAKVTSGNIKIGQLKAGNADLQTSSGNISFTVASDFAGFYDLRTSSGTIKSPDSKRQSQDVVKARTSSGNISVYER